MADMLQVIKIGCHSIQISIVINQIIPFPVDVSLLDSFLYCFVFIDLFNFEIGFFKQWGILFRFCRKVQICKNNVFGAVGVAGHIRSHRFPDLVDTYNLCILDWTFLLNRGKADPVTDCKII